MDRLKVKLEIQDIRLKPVIQTILVLTFYYVHSRFFTFPKVSFRIFVCGYVCVIVQVLVCICVGTCVCMCMFKCVCMYVYVCILGGPIWTLYD